MEYEEFKYTIFDLVCNSSRTIIKAYLRKLSEESNIAYDFVTNDFNEYTMDMWEIECE